MKRETPAAKALIGWARTFIAMALESRKAPMTTYNRTLDRDGIVPGDLVEVLDPAHEANQRATVLTVSADGERALIEHNGIRKEVTVKTDIRRLSR